LADHIDYYLHFAPVTTWEEIRKAVDSTPAGGKVNIGLLNSVSADAIPIDIPAGKTISLAAHQGDRTITRTVTTVPLFTVTGGTFTLGDSLTLDGGGVCSAPIVDGTGGHIILDGATITNAHSSTSGGVSIDNGTFTMKSGTISGNRTNSTYAGAGVLVRDGSFIMYGGEISNNHSTTSTSGGGGGGVFLWDSSFTMYNGKISGNEGRRGGGVYIVNSGSFTMYDGEISGNKALWDGGGGVCKEGNSDFTMHGGTIGPNNRALSGGGVSILTTCIFYMYGGEISGNTASSSSNYFGNGGGVFAAGSFEMYGGEISGNTASGTGADGNGGGVYKTGTGNFIKGGGTIYGDTNTSHSPGDIENTASSSGHAVYIDLGTLKRNTTAGPSITLDSAIPYPGGGWE
jgi:hypothetical protein